MPGLYRLDAPAAAVASALRAEPDGDVWPGGPVAPSGYAPVVIGAAHGMRRMVPRQWGVPPPPRGQHVVTHLRNLASPFWIGTLRHTQFRCLVPVTAFPEGRGWISVPGAPVFAFAGIWRDSEVPSFAIVTVEGDDPQGTTMPLILQPRDYGAWLHDDWKQAQDLVRPFPSPMLQRL